MQTTARKAQSAQRSAHSAPRQRTPVSTNSAYARASSEYQTSTGLIAHSHAITSATRGAKRSRNAQYAAGTTSVPARAEGSRRTAADDDPRAWLSSQESQ